MKSFLLFITFFMGVGLMSTFAQKKMSYQDKTMTLTIPRVNNNEAVVIISAPDIYDLSFESTLDKTVDVYNKVNESSFNYYFLKFVVGNIYRGRKLGIKVDGYDKTEIPIPLTAKEVKSFYVYDPDGTVGVGCYFQNRNEGNDFFAKAMYPEAKEKYQLALQCSDKPKEEDLNKRIDDSDMCMFLRRKADNCFGKADYEKAEEYYKEVLAINANDEYCQTRIKDSEEAFSNITRRVYGIVTDEKNKPLSNVQIKGAKKNEKGKFESKEVIGKTDNRGRYDIRVRQYYDAVEFTYLTYGKVPREIPKDSISKIDVAMPVSKAVKGISLGQSIINVINSANKK